MEISDYNKYLEDKEGEFEAICLKCGACCGALDDPCYNLVQTEDGKYFCRDYDSRIGLQKTVSGNSFHCVSIREHITTGTLHPGCSYSKI